MLDCVNLIIALITMGISIGALVVAIMAYQFAKNTYIENVKQERIRATLSDFPQLRKNNQELIMKIADLEEREKELCLKSYMSQMEYFAVGVNSGAYDLDIVNCMSGGMLVSQYEKHLRQFIVDRRKRKEKKIEVGEKVEVSPEKAYCEYEKMMKKLYELRGKEWEPVISVKSTAKPKE